MQEEIQKRQEILRQESLLTKNRRFSFESFSGSEDEHSFGENNCSLEDSSTSLCDHKHTDKIEFLNNGYRKIKRGSCIGKIFMFFLLILYFNFIFSLVFFVKKSGGIIKD